MKYIILLGDGMADEPLKELGGKTPLEVARTPVMDRLACRGELGMARTVKEGFPPGSDVANMAVLGLDPGTCYTGRAPIEAVSMGIDLSRDDTAFRINLVTIDSTQSHPVMEDYCSGHISTEEARILIKDLRRIADDRPAIAMYPGIEYRHLMVIHGYDRPGLKTTPPHDITGERIEPYLPNDPMLVDIINRSMMFLKDHPVNRARLEQGKRPATSLWPWGEGKAMQVPTLRDEYGLSGAMISAVDLLKGLGKLRGMEVIDVPGATGWIDTNYEGKAEAALDALSRYDLVYVHVEAPDEAGHGGYTDKKIQAIEDFDARIVGHIIERMELNGIPSRVLVMPDHPTPISKKTHTSDPVPYILYDSSRPSAHDRRFTEDDARKAGIFIEEGFTLLGRLLEKS
ncbi:MAG TPA: cofactor-independent phosphoglycerate mutase [Deltaproteobacteria bacterium]|nr:cofactor-independent phosphoglycerate mutase [Deltaproteobacteria bacterium]HPR55273.1 cofactor-independent phosphoglycerate mutase [Deltaproteobacteria bacterium]HXK46910.1 cofactor-independent phosphoglycerate mutase [Deltaproteobacteria bacterium]